MEIFFLNNVRQASSNGAVIQDPAVVLYFLQGGLNAQRRTVGTMRRHRFHDSETARMRASMRISSP